MAMPLEGHLDAVLHIFGYLKIKYICNEKAFKECDWKEIYGDVEEAITSNAPEPLP
jgi:hypothetical protein